MDRDKARARVAELSRAYAVQGLALEEMTAERDEARARVTELEADNERLRQDRLDYSCATTTEGMNASEWIWRTGKAERRAAELERAYAVQGLAIEELTAERDRYREALTTLEVQAVPEIAPDWVGIPTVEFDAAMRILKEPTK